MIMESVKISDVAFFLKLILNEVSEIFGTTHDAFSDLSNTFDANGFSVIFAETKLVGKCGYDISIGFTHDKLSFKTKEGKNIEEFFEKFRKQGIFGEPYFIEFDSFSGSPEIPAFFLTFEEKPIENCLDFFNAINEKQRISISQKLCKKIYPDMIPIHIGMFPNRENRPVRFTCRLSNNFSEIQNKIQNHLSDTFKSESSKIIRDIANFGFFYRWAFDFDILENGLIGRRFSYEFKIKKTGIDDKKNFLKSVEWKGFCDYVKNLGIADDRIYSLYKCENIVPLKNLDKKFISKICHFKLSWNDGQIEPLKVYVKGCFKG